MGLDLLRRVHVMAHAVDLALVVERVQMQFLVGEAAFAGHRDRDLNLHDDLAIAGEHVEHLEVLDLYRRHVLEELGDAGAAMPRLHRRKAGLLAVVVEPRLPGTIVGDLVEDEADLAATERFVDAADDGEVGGSALLRGTPWRSPARRGVPYATLDRAGNTSKTSRPLPEDRVGGYTLKARPARRRSGNGISPSIWPSCSQLSMTARSVPCWPWQTSNVPGSGTPFGLSPRNMSSPLPPSSVSLPKLPISVSLPSPPWTTSSAGPPNSSSSPSSPPTTSAPLWPVAKSLPAPERMVSAPFSPPIASSPVPPKIVSLPPGTFWPPPWPSRNDSPVSPRIESLPAPPSMRSLPRSPQMMSSPPRPKIVSLPPRPTITSGPLVPRRTSLPGVPTIVAGCS